MSKINNIASAEKQIKTGFGGFEVDNKYEGDFGGEHIYGFDLVEKNGYGKFVVIYETGEVAELNGPIALAMKDVLYEV